MQCGTALARALLFLNDWPHSDLCSCTTWLTAGEREFIDQPRRPLTPWPDLAVLLLRKVAWCSLLSTLACWTAATFGQQSECARPFLLAPSRCDRAQAPTAPRACRAELLLLASVAFHVLYHVLTWLCTVLCVYKDWSRSCLTAVAAFLAAVTPRSPGTRLTVGAWWNLAVAHLLRCRAIAIITFRILLVAHNSGPLRFAVTRAPTITT